MTPKAILWLALALVLAGAPMAAADTLPDPSAAPGNAGAAQTQRHASLSRIEQRYSGGGGRAVNTREGSVLLYTGNESSPDNGGNATYSYLEEATDRSVETASALPFNLSGNSCVLLQLNAEPFDGGQTTVLKSYIEGGGVVVGIGEYSGYDTEANVNLNNLASSLGAGLALQENALDSGFHQTTDFGDSPYASGLTSLSYAATAGIDVSGTAHTIARTGEGTPFIASQALGQGAFVLLGDSNVLSDFSDLGYFFDDNGVLAQNLCGEGNRFSRPWPAQGYGYSFQNRGMGEYASGAGLHPSDILLPSRLATTFSDWSYHRILSGFLPGTLQEEIEAAIGIGPLGVLWRSMLGGTCYGLALSGGRFADGSEALFSPSQSRGDATWNVGSGPSASTLLPEPHTGESSNYNKQFLQLDAADFVTQFAREAQSSFAAQAHAFANASTGVKALRQQLESVMGDGDDLYGSLSGPADTNFAMISLLARDSRSYGHEVLAYSFETIAGGGLKIDVWDNNFPGEPHYITVNSNGTWNYLEAPYPTNNGYRYFGSTYSLGGASGYSLGNIEVLPLYTPSGLHLYPGQGRSIVDVGPETVASSAIDENGDEPIGQLTASGSLEYAGESLLYDTEGGSLEIAGAHPGLDVRGAETYMALEASGPVQVADDAEQGSIGATGAPADLLVGRSDLKVESTGASSLALSRQGAVSAVANGAGNAEVTLSFEDGGSLDTATLFSGPTTPGENLNFSAAEVAAAQGNGSPPTPGAVPVSSPQGPTTTSPTAQPPRHKCRRGRRTGRTPGKPRCGKPKKHHKHKHR